MDPALARLRMPSHLSLCLSQSSLKTTQPASPNSEGRARPGASICRCRSPPPEPLRRVCGFCLERGPHQLRYHLSVLPQDTSSRKREGHTCLERTHERLLRKAKRCPPHFFSHFLRNQVIFQPLRGKNEREHCADGDKVTFLHPALPVMSRE